MQCQSLPVNVEWPAKTIISDDYILLWAKDTSMLLPHLLQSERLLGDVWMEVQDETAFMTPSDKGNKRLNLFVVVHYDPKLDSDPQADQGCFLISQLIITSTSNSFLSTEAAHHRPQPASTVRRSGRVKQESTPARPEHRASKRIRKSLFRWL
jgi:hypothetical protein